MSNFYFTLFATIIVMALAVLGLAIGWLITGKVKMKRGSCGYNPKECKEKKPSSCGSEQSCQLCSPAEKHLSTKIKSSDHDHR